nr:unnamed protein product [Digitaria exilis]
MFRGVLAVQEVMIYLLRKGKGKAKVVVKKKKKKKLPPGHPDNWEATMAVRGAAQFQIVDTTGSPTAPEGPQPPQPCRSGHTRSQTKPLVTETPASTTSKARPRPPSTATPTPTRGKKRAREVVSTLPEIPEGPESSDSNTPTAAQAERLAAKTPMFIDYKPAKPNDRRRGHRALHHVAQQWTPKQRAQYEAEDQQLRQSEIEVGLEGIQQILDSDSLSDTDSEDDDFEIPFVPPFSAPHDSEAEGSRSIPVTEAAPISQAPQQPGAPPPTTGPSTAEMMAVMMQSIQTMSSAIVQMQAQQQQQARQHAELMQSLAEQQRRQADFTKYQFQYLFQQTGIAPPPVFPGPPLQSLPRPAHPSLPPRVPMSPVRPMASLNSPQLAPFEPVTTNVSVGLPDIPTTFGTPTSTFFGQFGSTPAVTTVMTETTPLTSPGSSQLGCSYTDLLNLDTPQSNQPQPASQIQLPPQPVPDSDIQSALEAQILEATSSGAAFPLPDPPVRTTSGATPFLDEIEKEAEEAATAAPPSMALDPPASAPPASDA